MIKRITLLAGMALAAVAVMAPAAQADVSLSDAGGQLKDGAKVTATSTDLITTRPGGQVLHCKKVILHLELSNAGPTHLQLKQLGATTTEDCTLTRPGQPSLPMTIDDGTLGIGSNNKLTIDTWGTGVTTSTFATTIFGDAAHKVLVAACDFEGDVHVQATNGSDILKVGPSVLTDVGPAKCGESTWHGNFTLETPGGEEVKVNFQSTP